MQTSILFIHLAILTSYSQHSVLSGDLQGCLWNALFVSFKTLDKHTHTHTMFSVFYGADEEVTYGEDQQDKTLDCLMHKSIMFIT